VITTIKLAVVRIRAPDGRTVGAGFLVAEGQVLTCAHVVAAALGLPEDTPETPQAEVYLDFPLVAPGRSLTARVMHWQPDSDVAGLELDGDPPTGTRPVRLVTAKDLWAHAFRAFGFPSGYDDGVWASGVLRGRQAAGWVQIEDVKEPGYWVQPGFSGTAVWDEQLNGVVGMAVAADTDRGIKAAFMIPASLLIEAWPQLAQRSLEADSVEYLEEQLTLLEAAQQDAPDPRRFQARIDELQAAIAQWDGRVEQQRQRIADGLEAQRQQVAMRYRDEMRLRVVGRPPLDVADYFKDRERELATIGQLLAEPTTRLVSLIGHGGMGKTALACKVLRDMERHRWPHTQPPLRRFYSQPSQGFPPLDGILYLSTRTAGLSLERLFLDCAKVLGGEQEKRLNAIWTNPQIGTEDKIAHLLEAMSDGRYVLLLDNIEDLLDDQGQLVDADLRLFFEHSLTTSHGAQLLVTSRTALAFRREVMRFDRQVKLLEGLPIPDGIALLRELDPNGDYGLQAAPEEQLAQAVSLVHGVPRALEVLAGILANDPFASLDDVLEQFYGEEDVVHNLIEENYKRLDSHARRVIEALAVFRRLMPPLAVDYLLEPFVPGLDVPGIIRRLTRTNMVSVDRAAKTVTLHPIDQDYAYSQLPEDGSEAAYTRQALERRAADYYVQLRTPPETWKTIDDLEPQLAEFEHRVRAGDYDDACQVLEPIDEDYLYLWGHYVRLVELREKLLERLTEPGLQAANLSNLGCAYHSLGQVERAIKLHEQAVAIASEIGDCAVRGRHLRNLGNAYYSLGQVERAIKLYEQAVAIAREIGDRRVEGASLGNLGSAYYFLGQIERAIMFCEEALAIAREIGDRWVEGTSLGTLGSVYRGLGQVERAIKFYEEALAVAREINARWVEEIYLGSLGLAYRALGQVERAIRLYQEALAIAHEIGDCRKEGAWLGSLGRAYRDLGQVEQAIKLYQEALAVARETGDRRGESNRLGDLGRAYRDLGQVERAIKLYEQALVIAREIGDRWWEGICLDGLGIAYHSLEQIERAIEFHEQALAIACEIGDRRGESYRLWGLGRVLLTAGELSKARQHCIEALSLNAPEVSYRVALVLAIVLLRQYDLAAREAFADATARCQAMLDKTAGLYEPRYALAAALVGQAVCDPRWAKESERVGLLAPALAEYRRALEVCAALGVVRDALRDLEMIRAAGIEGLEPAFELLEGYGGEGTDVGGTGQ